MSKPIVVGVDDDPDSVAVLRWAINEATQRSLPLMLLHAGEAWAHTTGGGAVLQAVQTHGQKVVTDALAVVRAANRELGVSSLIEPGDPADTLISWSGDASMIVLGNRGQSALAAAVRGSIGAKVAAQANCPVIFGRPLPAGRKAPVVLGVDGSAASRAAAEFAFDYAARTGTGVRAVHAWHRSVLPGAGDLGVQRRAHSRVVVDALAKAADRHPGVPSWVVSTIGGATDILAYESMNAQLVVTGTHGHGARSGLLLGSVSQALIRSASCPLAVIRGS